MHFHSKSVPCAALLMMIVGGCSTGSPPPENAQQKRALAQFDLAKCQTLEPSLYRCPGIDKPLCDPDFERNAVQCVKVTKNGVILQAFPSDTIPRVQCVACPSRLADRIEDGALSARNRRTSQRTTRRGRSARAATWSILGPAMATIALQAKVEDTETRRSAEAEAAPLIDESSRCRLRSPRRVFIRPVVAQVIGRGSKSARSAYWKVRSGRSRTLIGHGYPGRHGLARQRAAS